MASYMPHSSPPPRGFSLSNLIRSSILRMVIAASVANLIDFTCNGGRLDNISQWFPRSFVFHGCYKGEPIFVFLTIVLPFPCASHTFFHYRTLLHIYRNPVTRPHSLPYLAHGRLEDARFLIVPHFSILEIEPGPVITNEIYMDFRRYLVINLTHRTTVSTPLTT